MCSGATAKTDASVKTAEATLEQRLVGNVRRQVQDLDVQHLQEVVREVVRCTIVDIGGIVETLVERTFKSGRCGQSIESAVVGFMQRDFDKLLSVCADEQQSGKLEEVRAQIQSVRHRLDEISFSVVRGPTLDALQTQIRSIQEHLDENGMQRGGQDGGKRCRGSLTLEGLQTQVHILQRRFDEVGARTGLAGSLEFFTLEKPPPVFCHKSSGDSSMAVGDAKDVLQVSCLHPTVEKRGTGTASPVRCRSPPLPHETASQKVVDVQDAAEHTALRAEVATLRDLIQSKNPMDADVVLDVEKLAAESALRHAQLTQHIDEVHQKLRFQAFRECDNVRQEFTPLSDELSGVNAALEIVTARCAEVMGRCERLERKFHDVGQHAERAETTAESSLVVCEELRVHIENLQSSVQASNEVEQNLNDMVAAVEDQIQLHRDTMEGSVTEQSSRARRALEEFKQSATTSILAMEARLKAVEGVIPRFEAFEAKSHDVGEQVTQLADTLSHEVNELQEGHRQSKVEMELHADAVSLLLRRAQFKDVAPVGEVCVREHFDADSERPKYQSPHGEPPSTKEFGPPTVSPFSSKTISVRADPSSTSLGFHRPQAAFDVPSHRPPSCPGAFSPSSSKEAVTLPPIDGKWRAPSNDDAWLANQSPLIQDTGTSRRPWFGDQMREVLHPWEPLRPRSSREVVTDEGPQFEGAFVRASSPSPADAPCDTSCAPPSPLASSCRSAPLRTRGGTSPSRERGSIAQGQPLPAQSRQQGRRLSDLRFKVGQIRLDCQ